jgi:hypothetical protein
LPNVPKELLERRDEIEALHGIHLVGSHAQLHVRAFSTNAAELSSSGLLAFLREQVWGSKPFDESVASKGGFTVVAGTFDTNQSEQFRFVREWFITDGERLANVALSGTREAVDASVDSAEQLVASLQFSGR